MVAVTGPSGGSESTTVNLFVGIGRPTASTVTAVGQRAS